MAGPAATRCGRGIANLTARGDTGLYDTTLAAVRDVRSKWRADQDVVVILSDGKNDDPGSISLKSLVATLKKEQDADKPVRVYTVAYGAQADAAALSAIAKATGGQSFVAASPADIERVLLAHSVGVAGDTGAPHLTTGRGLCCDVRVPKSDPLSLAAKVLHEPQAGHRGFQR